MVSTDFNNGIKAAMTQAKEFEKTVRATAQAAEDVGLVMTAAGGAVVAAMTGMVKVSADYGEHLNKMSIQTGIATEDLSKLGFAAEQNEASFEALSSGLKKMSSAADNGSKSFKEIGVETRDTTGQLRPMNDILLDVADQFKNMEDGTRKSALAVELFGRGGIELIPTLNLGRDGLLAMGNEAERLGIVMSGDAARAADEFNDTLSQVKDAALGLANVVAEALGPSLTSVSALTRDGVVALKDFTKEHETVTQAVFGFSTVILGAGGLLLALSQVASMLPKVEAGLKLVGLAASAADLGVAGLGAAVGIGIGSFINYAIAGTKVEAALDSYLKKTLEGIPILGAWWFATGDLEKGEKAMADATQKVNEVLALHNMAVERGTMGVSEWNTKVMAAAQHLDVMKDVQSVAADTAARHADITKTVSGATDQFTDSVKHAAVEVQGITVDVKEWGNKFEELPITMAKVAKQLEMTDVDIAAAHLAILDRSEKDVAAMEAGAFALKKDLRHTDLDDAVVSTTLRVAADQKAWDEQERAANKYHDAFVAAIANLNTRIAESFADMVVHAKFNMDSLIGIAQTTASSMLSAFLSGLISPFTEKLAGLGASAASAIGMGTAAAGAGGTAALNAAGFTADAAGAGGGIGGALTGLLTNPITGVIAGLAAGAIGWVKSQAHWEANDLVQNLQNPFDQKFGQLYNLAATNQDTLSGADMMSAHDAMWSLWAATIDSVQAWAGSSSDRQRVASQFFETEIPVVGPALQEILDLANNRLMQGLATGTPLVTKEGPFYLHAGEAVIPASQNPNAGGSGMGGDLYLTVNVAAGSRATALEIREQMELFVDDFDGNVRGFKTRITAGVKSHWDSVVTA